MTGEIPWQKNRREELEQEFQKATKSDVKRESLIPPQLDEDIMKDECYRAFVLRLLSIKKEERPSAAAAKAELQSYCRREEERLNSQKKDKV